MCLHAIPRPLSAPEGPEISVTWAELEEMQFYWALEERVAPHRTLKRKTGVEPFVVFKHGSGKCFRIHLLISHLLATTIPIPLPLLPACLLQLMDSPGFL